MSFWQRVSSDTNNAFQDVYSHWVLGDDAGKSALVVWLCDRRHLGLSFLEIHGRAYVKAVSPDSAAAKAGILPQDAVQLAVPVEPDWVRGPDDNDSEKDKAAKRYAVDLEKKGARITYDQLLRLLSDQVLDNDLRLIKKHFLSPPVKKEGSFDNDSSPWNGPPIPSTICAPMLMVTTDSSSSDHDDAPPGEHSSNRRKEKDGSGGDAGSRSGSVSSVVSEHPRGQMQPIVFVLRRTRQRPSTESAGLLAFRLDDECDLASSLVRRLAPTADMRAPAPNAWDELVHDGTDFLLGPGSLLPPKGHDVEISAVDIASASRRASPDTTMSSIPLDDFERVRAQKLASLRARMTAEAMQVDRTDDVEAATIRGMIQKAVGLAFVRANKVVLGVSFHCGTGIVISRLSDGTWSAPSAIGTWGLGFGLQFGLEFAEYIFILQTQEALQHFRRGGSYTVGGSMGIAVGGMGREAYGAASLGGLCGTTSTVQQPDDAYNDEEDSRNGNQFRPARSLAIAPIVAYAKSQGLYVGVSLEGSRIYTREDMNSRTYKFTCGKNVTADDILSGKVPTPPEAEELYAALHSVEFAHEMSCLPRPPEVLRKDSAHAWSYDRSTLAENLMANRINRSHSSMDSSGNHQPFSFLSLMTEQENDDCVAFEAQFKNFMYGGVSVQRLIRDSESGSGRTGKERRTLWLMLPEVGSLRLGFVSKLSDGDSGNNISNKNSTLRARRDDTSRISTASADNDIGTVGSEDLTLDSALQTKDGSTIGPIRTGNVQLSDKHSVALTDVTILSQDPRVPIKISGEDKTQHLRIISIQDVSGTSLLFLANNFREAELLVCGLKLLLERETARLGVRGGLPITALGGKNKEGAMSPSAARGFREIPSQAPPPQEKKKKKRLQVQTPSVVAETALSSPPETQPYGRKNWSKQPGRNYMRGQASSLVETEDHVVNEQGVPHYVHGQQITRDVVKNVLLPLPLAVCRVLLFDSTSPVIEQWETARGDKNFEKTGWGFPPATPREFESHESEHELIASGSMSGAHRTVSFDRPRYGSLVRLSETLTVEADDPEKVTFTVTERNPRRGFSLKVRIFLRAHRDDSCVASVAADVRPVGKDMSNQAAVHKAFLLVLDELKVRYGTEEQGLLDGFLAVIDQFLESKGKSPTRPKRKKASSHSLARSALSGEEKSDIVSNLSGKSNGANGSGLVSFEDMLKTGRESPEEPPRPTTPSLLMQVPESNPAKRISSKKQKAVLQTPNTMTSSLEQAQSSDAKKNVLIEVKPLPKIRLSLMPPPREEDEERSSSDNSAAKRIKRKKKKRGSRSGSRRRTNSASRKPSNSQAADDEAEV